MDKNLSKYVFIQTVASFIINAVLNGLIIFFLAWGKTVYTVGYSWILITFAIDNFITCPLLGLFAANGAVKNLKKEKTIFSLPPDRGFIAVLSSKIQKPKRFGLLVGLVASVIIFGFTCAGVFLFHIEILTKWGYVIYKAAYTGVLGAVFSLILNNAALHRPLETASGTV